jgi:hypothetical protein
VSDQGELIWAWTLNGDVFQTRGYDRSSTVAGLIFVPAAGGTLLRGQHAFDSERKAIKAALAYFHEERQKMASKIDYLEARLNKVKEVE